ncbi:MAG: hypothetical protein RMN52_12525 [Anaerolineae bacterium]|nr:hypothetical protein [Candidatus Roseilinea sp.]MDW8450816.1 hypothetical protein [Anaerolineae bacterium]
MTQVSVTNEMGTAAPMWKGADVLVMSLAIVAGIGVGALALIGPSVVSSDAAGGQMTPLFMTGLAAVQAVAMLVAVWLLGLNPTTVGPISDLPPLRRDGSGLPSPSS